MMESYPPRLVDLTVAQYAAQLASGDAAPGGGSATALAGALAAGLASMVARLTIGRERYASVQETMLEVEKQGERLRSQLLALIDADTAAYSQVMVAYRMPKETPEQRVMRASAIEEALKHAADIPLAVAEACLQVLNLAAVSAQFGNRNAASDAAVGGLLAHAALQGAVRNVQINVAMIKDTQFRAVTEARLAGLTAKGESALRRTLNLDS